MRARIIPKASQVVVACYVVLCAGWASQVYADQLVFGSFKSAQNAQNWAQKLSVMFAQDIRVTEFHGVGSNTQAPVFRVNTDDLSEAEFVALQRRAQASGISSWRLIEAEPDTTPPRATPRRTPPSPILESKPAVTEQAVASADVSAGQASLNEEIVNEETVPRRSQTRTDWDLGLQTRSFADTGVFGQDQFEGSISLQWEYYRGWANDSRSITFTPFVRLDSADNERTHGDVRELFYSHIGDRWDVHVGAKRIFWGVTEFHHLVDIINQTDLVENIDTEDKLGQPMAHLSLVRDWGIVDLFALTGFRERTFPGSDGRVRLPFRVLGDVEYESGAENKRIDAAIRWSHYLGPFEIGLHHFSGTSREPILRPELTSNNNVVLRPYYPVIEQTGIDAQAFYGDWAFKLEGISRGGFGDRYVAANVGVERTLVGVFGSRADLGLVAEYMFDERDDEAFNTLFEHDIALGGRLSLNDFGDTQALLGVIFDTENDDYFVSLEASRRLSDSWLFSFEGRVFAGGETLRRSTPVAVLLQPEFKSAFLQEDDYLQLEFKKFL